MPLDRSDFSPPRGPAPRPEDVRVTRDGRSVRIEFGWLPAKRRRALLIVGVVALVLLPPLGILFIYPVLAHVFDRTLVTLGDGWIRVVSRPLPFPRGGRVRVDEVEELRVNVTRESQTGSTHTGAARLRDGRERTFLYEQDPERGDTRVRWVVEELTRELASGRWTAAGERRPSSGSSDRA